MTLDKETQDALLELLKNAGVTTETIELVKKDLSVETNNKETTEKPNIAVMEVTIPPAERLMASIKKMKG